MSVPDKVIELDSNCCPFKNPERLNTQARDVIWTRKDGTAVIQVRIDSVSPDGKPRDFWDLPGSRINNNKDYLIHYKGASRPPLRTFAYSTNCQDGKCGGTLGKGAETAPELTNGPD